MTKKELKSLIKECITEVVSEKQEVYTIQEMMDREMLKDVPEIEISDSEYNRIINESIEVDDIDEIL